MKIWLFIIILTILLLSIFTISCMKMNHINSKNKSSKISFYNLEAKSVDGEIISMSNYKDKKILIVNVASECGYTPQYKSLQKLYQDYKDNLYILAFPSNDFLNQEPGTNEEIKNFCNVNFGVKFDIFEKISVKGKDIHPIYNWLSNKDLNGWNNKVPVWNFSKYLIDQNGNLEAVWGPSIKPLSNNIINKLTSKN